MPDQKILQLHDAISLHGVEYIVRGHPGAFFLLNRKGYNDAVFTNAGYTHKAARDMVSEIIGEEERGGIFPECRTLEQLTKVVETIRGSAG